MPEFSDAVLRLRAEERPGAKQFGTVVARLADDGVIVSGDSHLETELYEAAAELEEEIRDFFGVLGCTLYHNRKLAYIRLFPPAAKSPCVVQVEGAKEDEGQPLAGMRRKGNPNVAAALLALRAIYQQKIAMGDLSSGNGEVTTSIEDVYVTMRIRLKREECSNAQDRRAVLRELEIFWRVIRIPVEANTEERDTRITIRPLIADLISDSVAQKAEEDAKDLASEKGEEDEA